MKFSIENRKRVLVDLDELGSPIPETQQVLKLRPWEKEEDLLGNPDDPDYPSRKVEEKTVVKIWNGSRIADTKFFDDEFDAKAWLTTNGYNLLRDEKG
ncbi:MAG: hypothetical protein A2605_02280 [Candidatus Zambryskibacteria bacterium RIFOXYD1_FULL_39_35]|nr:MAG: hypothetical protein A2605_02280 [Candidatus Zambryskibacteria bacterium RIFOXYD1_FULL_39_35]